MLMIHCQHSAVCIVCFTISWAIEFLDNRWKDRNIFDFLVCYHFYAKPINITMSIKLCYDSSSLWSGTTKCFVTISIISLISSSLNLSSISSITSCISTGCVGLRFNNWSFSPLEVIASYTIIYSMHNYTLSAWTFPVMSKNC